MRQVSVYEAKTTLSALLKVVAAGEEVVITHRTTPIARLLPYATGQSGPVFGSARAAMLAGGHEESDVDAALDVLTRDDGTTNSNDAAA